MLTADLSGAKKKGDTLYLPKLDKRRLALAADFATQIVGVYAQSLGSSRAEVQALLAEIVPLARDRKIVLGLQKIAEDKACFEVAARADLPELRLRLFQEATKMRMASRMRADFKREEALAKVAQSEGMSADDLDDMLFADLKEAQRLTEVGLPEPRLLVEAWRLGRVQAVLLRATEVRAHLRGASAEQVRRLFARLKLHQLLFTLEENEDGYVLTLDGPLSLFEQSTRYGLRLAICLPLLLGFENCEIEAKVLWGKSRKSLLFAWSASSLSSESRLETRLREAEPSEAMTALVADWNELGSDWEPRASQAILHLPGVGLCVPDLDFESKTTGEIVHFELLGFWSRAAVWKRVVLVEKGLCAPMVFGVSSRLRVSERALDGEETAGLVVFKGKLRAKSVLAAIQAVSDRKASVPCARTP